MLNPGVAVVALALVAGPVAYAAEPPPVAVTLTLKAHRFSPDTVTAPAGARIIVTLINQDLVGEEFDSDDLRVEEEVTPKARIVFRLGPLKPGTYRFMGEGHPQTAQGRLIVVAPAS